MTELYLVGKRAHMITRSLVGVLALAFIPSVAYASYYACTGFKSEANDRVACSVEKLSIPQKGDDSFSWIHGCGISQILLSWCSIGPFDSECQPGEIDVIFKVGPNDEDDESWSGQSRVRLTGFPEAFTVNFQQSPPEVEAELRCTLKE